MNDDGFDPVRAAAVERILERMPDQPSPPKARTGVRSDRAIVRITTVVVAAAVVLLGVVVLQVSHPRAPAGEPAPEPLSTPSKTLVEGGVTLRYVGVVPWRSAVRAAADSTQVTISADGDLVHGAGRVCGGTAAQRVEVRESGNRVEILVLGYADPIKSDAEDCIGVGHPSTKHVIRLAVPLGARPLVDLSDGSEHAVLTDGDVPRALRVPAGFEDLGVSWDDRSPGVARDYGPGADPVASEHIGLEIGPAGGFQAPERPYWEPAPGTTVHGSTASVWRHTDMYNVNTLVVWRRGRDVYQVASSGTPSQHLAEQQVVAFAQSVQVRTRALPGLPPP